MNHLSRHRTSARLPAPIEVAKVGLAISSDGTRIAYDSSGEGLAIVLAGGAFQHCAIDQRTKQFAAPLSKRSTVVNYDRGGRGHRFGNRANIC